MSLPPSNGSSTPDPPLTTTLEPRAVLEMLKELPTLERLNVRVLKLVESKPAMPFEKAVNCVSLSESVLGERRAWSLKETVSIPRPPSRIHLAVSPRFWDDGLKLSESSPSPSRTVAVPETLIGS